MVYHVAMAMGRCLIMIQREKHISDRNEKQETFCWAIIEHVFSTNYTLGQL